jgi:hypothetical protein
MRKTNQDVGASDRPKRVPINGSRDIMNVRGIPPELHPCWVNDTDNNIERYQNAGYNFWTGEVVVGDRKIDSDSQIGSGVISKNVGNGVTAFLMVVPVEIYNEDQKSLQSELAEKEAVLFRSMKQGEGRYGDIKVTTSVVKE